MDTKSKQLFLRFKMIIQCFLRNTYFPGDLIKTVRGLGYRLSDASDEA